MPRANIGAVQEFLKTRPGLAVVGAENLNMKKILIIEDDQIVANVYRNKLAVEGYQVETAPDGETGLKIMRTFKPDTIILDLMLPGISGVDVIKQVRSRRNSARPIMVFSNTYLTNLIQEAWKAGANKCLSKSSCTPKDVIDIVRAHHRRQRRGCRRCPAPVIGTHAAGETNGAQPKPIRHFRRTCGKPSLTPAGDTYHPAPALQSLVKADNEMGRLKEIYELYRRSRPERQRQHRRTRQIAHMSAALEALLKEIYEKPKNINTSTVRTVAPSVDFLGFLFEHGTLPETQELPPAKILVVDDEAISRRAIIYAFEKARFKSVNFDDSTERPCNSMSENDFDLVFLDVDMPSMTGFELCAKLRPLPPQKNPGRFCDQPERLRQPHHSTMAGGNDFIAKPFLFIELTVKASSTCCGANTCC